MKSLIHYIRSSLSARLSLMVVFMVALLLMVALSVMFYFSRKAVKMEAIKNAEETLETTAQQIDNILLSIEQAAGNMYWNMVGNLDNPDMMFTYSRKLVETNPYAEGCAIAFEPYYFKERGEYFMAYVHRTDTGHLVTSDSAIIQANIFGNRPYNEQIWYTKPMESSITQWLGPLKNKDTEDDALITFSMPIYTAKGVVGVLAIDVALSLLTQITLAAKPSPNSYCTLLGSDGSFIVHPDSVKLYYQTVFTQTEHGTDPTAKEAAEAMVSGKTGSKFFRLNDKDYYVFFKPFTRAAVPGRSEGDLGWSIGIVYPDDDIFDDYNLLLSYVLVIAVVGLLLSLICCRAITHHRLLPLRMLTQSAQHIADGHYDEPIPDSHQHDEIGRLQNHFQQMQQALNTHVCELKQLTATLQEQGEVLHTTYEQAQEANQMKTAFLHQMTNQMTEPSNTINQCVNDLNSHYQDMTHQEAVQLTDNIQRQGKVIAEMLKNLLDVSKEKPSKKETEDA